MYNLNNRFVTLGAERRTLSEWCREYGISKQLVNWRIKHGWDEALAIITPVRGWRHSAVRNREGSRKA